MKNKLEPEPSAARLKIPTLIDHEREGRFVIAYCPICDHVEETKDDGGGRERTQSVSVARIEMHILKRHRAKGVHGRMRR